MIRVLTYSLLLTVGMALSQVPVIEHWNTEISAMTMIFLAYIMIQVGLEFEIDKSRLRKYGVDYVVAMAAAAVPWLTAALYFWWFFNTGVSESLLIGRFAAPTSAGILFTMLAAAGLAATWTYKKARVLAIFDDLDTVLLMIPLKMMLLGFTAKLLGLGAVVIALLLAAYYMIHWLRVPTNNFWVLGYAVLVWSGCFAFDYITELHLEVLLPAFALGCIIKSDHLHGSEEFDPESRGSESYNGEWEDVLDRLVKGSFMLLAGMALPTIQFGNMSLAFVAIHVLLLTFLMNVGKCVPLTTYRDEAGIRERAALSLGMFPRGEVGIGVLLVSLEIFHQTESLTRPGIHESISLGALSLALNLCLTGFFILGVIKLLNGVTAVPRHSLFSNPRS
ncbi:MAG TPA: cation:proton antiporter [Candidatus Binatia bacterium]|nr:cation:proton antiporter [Candidatus Binatia bacterium]